ncbi:tetratricopeptide repeat protein [Thioclava sp. 'Guangxiensis']|uniref:tetratricopeptide repeat protein n=1 Tax=Thioclava sp. 'Guangxiensis' TaxID=3149044 RepID=UPI00387796CC
MPFRMTPVRALALSIAALQAPMAFAADAPDAAGAYLAARAATADNDYQTATGYYAQLLQKGIVDRGVAESSMTAQLVLGDFDKAVEIANQVAATDADAADSQPVFLMRLADAVRNDRFDEALKLVDSTQNIGPLFTQLYRAWVYVGQGKMTDAFDAFDQVAKLPGLQGFAEYHKALAMAQVGDFESADKILSGEASDAIHATRRGVMAHVEVLSNLDRNADAVALLKSVFGDALDPQLAALSKRLEDGETLPFDVATNAQEGVGELYYSIGAALSGGDVEDAVPLLHARIAQWLNPRNADATLLAASVLDQQEQYDLAIATYDQIDAASQLHYAAELGKAETMMRAGQADEAIKTVQAVAEADPELRGVWVSLGDMLRREERFGEAAEAYQKALSRIQTPEPRDWFVYYAAGISDERSDKWDRAEGEFRKALELNPGQPSVLNYLGYSYVEKGENLEEALKMIREAVKNSPDSGYIIDSLGWALFRLGRYDEAVTEMEKAATLESVDPLVNDHLGDVYWAVGREREARFQWKRAIAFGPGEDVDMDRVQRKLDMGLDAVLKEEGAAPLKAQPAVQ